jgi:phage major head subunit gpT-like protein
MSEPITRELPALQLRATISAESVKADSRTVDVVWSTGARVLRGYFDRYWEELSMRPEHVQLGRLQSGAPLLDSHNAYSLDGVIGVTESARIEKGQGIARVRFARDEDNEAAGRFLRMVRDGVIRNVSVGYMVHRLEKVETTSDKIPVMRATLWEPFEISLVPIGADAAAGVRAAGEPTNPCQFFMRSIMEKHEQENIPAEDMAVERERCARIMRGARTLGVPDELAEEMIRDGVSAADAAARMIDEHAKRSPTRTIKPGGRARIEPMDSIDSAADFRAAASDAILMRAGVRVTKPHPAVGDVSGSVHDIARTCVSRAGRTVGKGNEALIRGAMTTGDFPLILADSMHKATRTGYEQEPASHRDWIRAVPVSDFRDQNRPILGSAPALEHVIEHGEYEHGSMTEDSTSYRIKKYGKIVALSWEAMVNDDLSAFMRIQPSMGQAARRLEADLVYDLFTENTSTGPTMQDGIFLFHVDHGNLTSAGALSSTTLGAARTKLRKQTALGGGYMSLVPRFLIVPAELEQDAEILLASATRVISSSIEADTPQWIAQLQLVVEPRLAATAFYLAADNGQIDTIEMGLLDENFGGPYLEEEREFNKDSYRWKVRHTVGVKALDWRGLVKVPTS